MVRVASYPWFSLLCYQNHCLSFAHDFSLRSSASMIMSLNSRDCLFYDRRLPRLCAYHVTLWSWTSHHVTSTIVDFHDRKSFVTWFHDHQLNACESFDRRNLLHDRESTHRCGSTHDRSLILTMAFLTVVGLLTIVAFSRSGSYDHGFTHNRNLLTIVVLLTVVGYLWSRLDHNRGSPHGCRFTRD